jgi:glycosyltransferase involved in cell wall biosynthesis
MRVVVQCGSILPDFSGGVENFVYGLLDALASYGSNEYLVTIPRNTTQSWREKVSPRPNLTYVELPARGSLVLTLAPHRDAPGVRTLHSIGRQIGPLSALFDRMKLGATMSLVSRLNPDLTYFPFHHDHCFSAKSVVTVHDLGDQLGPFVDERVAQRVSNNIRVAGAVVTSWPHPFGQIKGAFPLASPKLFMVPLPPLVSSGFAPTGRPPSGSGEPYVILYAASTARHKNHVRLVSAMAEVVRQRRVHLYCTGPKIPPYFDQAMAAVLEHDLGEYVTFTGVLSQSELTNLYERATLIVAPTLWEAASGTVFEAFWHGKPVACSDILPLREQIEYVGASARFFDPYDPLDIACAILEVLEEPKSFVDGAARGRQFMKEWTWERTAGNYLAVFDWVMRGGDVHQRPVLR